jgi:hypothetical protein
MVITILAIFLVIWLVDAMTGDGSVGHGYPEDQARRARLAEANRRRIITEACEAQAARVRTW